MNMELLPVAFNVLGEEIKSVQLIPVATSPHRP